MVRINVPRQMYDQNDGDSNLWIQIFKNTYLLITKKNEDAKDLLCFKVALQLTSFPTIYIHKNNIFNPIHPSKKVNKRGNYIQYETEQTCIGIFRIINVNEKSIWRVSVLITLLLNENKQTNTYLVTLLPSLQTPSSAHRLPLPSSSHLSNPSSRATLPRLYHSLPPSHSTSQLDRGVPLGGGGGGQNLTLSYCARRTKNTPCHNIPY